MFTFMLFHEFFQGDFNLNSFPFPEIICVLYSKFVKSVAGTSVIRQFYEFFKIQFLAGFLLFSPTVRQLHTTILSSKKKRRKKIYELQLQENIAKALLQVHSTMMFGMQQQKEHLFTYGKLWTTNMHISFLLYIFFVSFSFPL